MWYGAALLALTLAVVIHEAGHTLMAWRAGVTVREFNIGFGPKVLTLGTWRGMPINLRLLLLGGSVEIPKGGPDQPVIERTYGPSWFKINVKGGGRSDTRPGEVGQLDVAPGQQVAIMLGGIAFNLLSCLALVFVGVLLSSNGDLLRALIASVGATVLNLLTPILVFALPFLPTLDDGRVLVGPIGIVELIGNAGREGGFGRFLVLVGAISGGLGGMNLLPLPLLDGGHVLFIALHKLRGRPVVATTQLLATMVCGLFFVALALYLTGSDIYYLLR